MMEGTRHGRHWHEKQTGIVVRSWNKSMSFPEKEKAGEKLRLEKLSLAMGQIRKGLATVALFSLFINLLMLVAPLYMLQVYDRVLTSHSVETLILLTLMAGVSLLVLALLDHMRTTLAVRIGGWFSREMGPELLASGVQAKLQGARTGVQPLQDLALVQGFIANQGMIAFFDAPWVPIFIFIIFMLHPLLGMLTIFTAFVLLLLSLFSDLLSRRPTAEASKASFDSIQLAETTLRRGEEVEAMGFLPNLVQRWEKFNNTSIGALGRSGEINGIIVAATKFVRFFAQIAILGLGAWLVIQGEATPGSMIAASIMLGRALAPVEMALGSWKNFVGARQAYDRIKQHLQKYGTTKKRMKLPDPKGVVNVSNLQYTPPGGRDPILQDMNFALEPGKAVAVIGPSGAGKSTMCRMLLGLNQPDKGEVRLDGTNISHWDRQNLGRHIGYLPQEVELFSGTISENIARMARVDEEKVFKAARLANADEVIQNLPDGFDTVIGDGGLRLSGGQRQRIGLARAVYNDPKLIVLDEPNANLDQIGEQALSEAIESLKSMGCALVVVGHRPSTVAQADSIMLIQNGTVSLFGPRDEVLMALSQPGAMGAPPAGQENAAAQPAPQQPRRRIDQQKETRSKNPWQKRRRFGYALQMARQARAI